MGRQIVKQPDGKYAIWSSVVDDFVCIDCADADEIVEDMVSDIRRSITNDVNRVLVKLESGGKPYYQHTKTFDECMEIIREVHGDERAEEMLKEFGFNA